MIRPSKPVGSARRVASFPEQRICVTPGCSTILSIYNAELRCGIHAGEWRSGVNGAK